MDNKKKEILNLFENDGIVDIFDGGYKLISQLDEVTGKRIIYSYRMIVGCPIMQPKERHLTKQDTINALFNSIIRDNEEWVEDEAFQLAKEMGVPKSHAKEELSI